MRPFRKVFHLAMQDCGPAFPIECDVPFHCLMVSSVIESPLGFGEENTALERPPDHNSQNAIRMLRSQQRSPAVRHEDEFCGSVIVAALSVVELHADRAAINAIDTESVSALGVGVHDKSQGNEDE